MADYYLSAAGDDGNGGSYAAPWKTITRLNTAFSANTIQINDRVFLRRGDTFFGAIRPRNIDPDSTPYWIFIGAYGDETAPPIVSGYKHLNIPSGWVQHDANTWKINISTAQWGTTHTGYDSAQGYGNVGILRIDGQIYADNKYTLAELTNQWDYYTDGIQFVEGLATTLYVRSSAKPTTLAADIQCTVDCDGVQFFGGAIQVADLDFCGWGGCGAYFKVGAKRNRLLRCITRDIGGAYYRIPTDLSGRYGNGVQVWRSTSDIYCEQNIVHDVYDTAYSIQGGIANTDTHFQNITWRRNLTYRCSQAEEYWYEGNGAGFVNCVSEYNTNLFSGYGFGADTRPDPEVRVAQLAYHLGWNGGVGGGYVTIEMPTMRRNIYYDARASFAYVSSRITPMAPDLNVVAMRPGTLMMGHFGGDYDDETIEQAASWAAINNRDAHSQFHILPASVDADISDADVTAAIAALDGIVRMGQLAGNKVLPIHAPWRNL